MDCFQPGLLPFFKLFSLVSGLQFATASFPHVPFITVWNAPSANCLSQYGVDLDLGTFNIVQNRKQTFMGENMTIFYSNKLGLYPRYSSQGEAVNGGVPQNASLDEHLRVASENIRSFIPDTDFQGLAVVDWESWRPIWERDWDTMRVYQEASRALVRAKHPEWSPAQVEVAARQEFEDAGRKFMAETLKLGQQERPNGLWGYYGFPRCFNQYSDKSLNYTGECPEIEMKRNDELLWLWNVSSALYPSIYLRHNMLNLGREVFLYTRYRILEAMRAAARRTPSAPPTFAYAHIVYITTLDFLSPEHLVATIGESAALGCAGVVLWGDHYLSNSKAACEAVKSYIDETLGSYLVNITSAATLCSQTLCSSHGRCQRMNPNSKSYLHLDPAVWKVVSERRPGARQNYRVLGEMKTHEVKLMRSEFRCECYKGWGGERCSNPTRGWKL